MGNCGLKGVSESLSSAEIVRVVTSNGGIMELTAPLTADDVTASFPGHAIFRSRDVFSSPMLHSDDLLPGPHAYYLLPLIAPFTNTAAEATPYRVSCEKPAAAAEVVRPRYKSGVWKVKLVISPEQLSDILSQESRTHALIQSVRTVAKCGGGGSSSAASSDHWSVASSSNGFGRILDRCHD